MKIPGSGGDLSTLSTHVCVLVNGQGKVIIVRDRNGPLRSAFDVANNDGCGKVRKGVLANHFEVLLRSKVGPDRWHDIAVPEEKNHEVYNSKQSRKKEKAAKDTARPSDQNLRGRPLGSRNQGRKARGRRGGEEKVVEVESRRGRRERTALEVVIGAASAEVQSSWGNQHLGVS